MIRPRSLREAEPYSAEWEHKYAHTRSLQKRLMLNSLDLRCQNVLWLRCIFSVGIKGRREADRHLAQKT